MDGTQALTTTASETDGRDETRRLGAATGLMNAVLLSGAFYAGFWLTWNMAGLGVAALCFGGTLAAICGYAFLCRFLREREVEPVAQEG